MSALGQKQTFCGAEVLSKSGHVQCREGCPLSANSGHFTPHSVTSSAMDNTAAGIVSPKAFVAFRLSTNSNFVG